VAQKTFAMAEAMLADGREVELVAVSDQPVPDTKLPFLQIRSAVKSEYLSEATRFFESLHPDDVVIFRYPFASDQLRILVKRFGKHIVFEHNTIEQAEMLLMQREHFKRQRFSWTWGYWKYAFQTNVLRSTMESRVGPQILANVQGGICVSKEIQQYELSRCTGYKSVTIANGAEVPRALNLQDPLLEDELVVTMLIGSEAIWHGYERLFAGLLASRDLSKRILIRIIGIDQPDSFSWPAESRHRVEWLGKKSKQDISVLLQHCHIAVGTLALYRKSMTEASPLKVRECLLLGMPMILGYHDTDVSDDERFDSFLFKVKNDDSPIDWQTVISWFSGINQMPGYRRTIALLAADVLSMRAKAARYLQFLDELDTE